MSKAKVSGKEFAWYVVGGIFAIAGIALMIFGIIGANMNVPLDANFIKSAEKVLKEAIKIPLDFRTWGIIFLAFGMFILILTLNFNAKKADREIEKTIRRQQRIGAGISSTIAVKDAVQVVEEKPELKVEAAQAPEEEKKAE